MKEVDISAARNFIKKGHILAYPTEAVYGLGCDPFNKLAVENLLGLKNRPASKGLILLISKWEQLENLVKPLPDHLLKPVKASWPGPVTWVFPKADTIPPWVSGDWDTIAIRMSAHPIASELAFDGPVISTSANISGVQPARTKEELLEQFPSGIDIFVQGALGGATQPSSIYEVLTGKKLR